MDTIERLKKAIEDISPEEFEHLLWEDGRGNEFLRDPDWEGEIFARGASVGMDIAYRIIERELKK